MVLVHCFTKMIAETRTLKTDSIQPLKLPNRINLTTFGLSKVHTDCYIESLAYRGAKVEGPK